MADQPDTTRDWRDTVFLPKTDFPMKAGLAQKEPAILAKWAQDDLYGTLRKTRKGRERFILHDGPPYANGDIHMGHAMNKVLKDIIVRSQSLLGKDAPYVPGWDCHGLPIEWKVEEQYRKKKLNKDEVPVNQFRAECRAYAETWVNVQRDQFKRLGVMGDWDDPYLTMKYEAEATIAAELLKFAETGQLYRGAKPVMWSPVEKTALAEAEVEYEDITSTQIDVAFEIVETNIDFQELVGRYGLSTEDFKAVIWTTTPWTIPVNQAIAYSPDIEYALISYLGGRIDFSGNPGAAEQIRKLGTGDGIFIVALDLVDTFAARYRKCLVDRVQLIEPDAKVVFLPEVNGGKPVVLATFKGSELAGTVARHPMHHLSGFFAKPRPFLPGEFVTTDAGTGLVHMAPDHGEDDFLLCKAHGINPVFAVEGDGKYRADWAWLGGQGSVINPKFNAPDGPICTDLRDAGGLLAASADFQHSYPHSWRSKAKVIFRCTPQWFIGMDRPLAPSPHRGEGWGEGERGEAERPIATAEHPHPTLSLKGEGSEGNTPTLRELALDAIDHTRFVPDKGRNRIGSMVAGRPDWVISRQRAWGVPIAVYVNPKTGEYLNDPAVNSRIIEAFRKGGADAWYTDDHSAFLGEHAGGPWEPVNDILDVWFDSGSTHSFVVEARYGEGVRANLYLEGSDQHRGWFQSSLLESCGTRGRAPYDAVLTHGFALDGQGRKMSKSLGNVVDPLKVIDESGADILRLWVASTDYFEDVRIGKEVLAGTSDTYRKLRNTFRYMLGALDGFSDAERVPVAEMPELERYVLHLLATLDAELKAATEAFEFNRYARALSEFANNDLSAFFFDIRKDCLYCDAPDSPKRRAYRTVLDTLFHALVRYATPILCFTSEEVWGSRFPDAGSVHLLEWPDLSALSRHPSESWDLPSSAPNEEKRDSSFRWNDEQVAKWERLRATRAAVSQAIEPLRREKILGSSLEAVPALAMTDGIKREDYAELFISALPVEASGEDISITKTTDHKCGRCWRHLPEVTEDGALCDRCTEVVGD